MRQGPESPRSSLRSVRPGLPNSGPPVTAADAAPNARRHGGRLHLFRRIAEALVCVWLLVSATGALAEPASRGMKLRWTAPGDDGGLGRATRYDIRYSRAPITESTFSAATQVRAIPAPGPAGTIENYTVTDLEPGLYYFAIKACDEAGNWSRMSNLASASWSPADLLAPEFSTSFAMPAPNPARQWTEFGFVLSQPAPIEVDVFDAAGRRVRALARGWHDAGPGSVGWDLRDEWGNRLRAGLYLIRARVGGNTWVRRVAVLR
jgi:flagellar hook capping protein FlgD